MAVNSAGKGNDARCEMLSTPVVCVCSLNAHLRLPLSVIR